MERFEFWKRHKPSALFILSDRPSFTGQGTDSSVYAWVVWCDPKIYSGIHFLSNIYKTFYNRNKTIKMFEQSNLGKVLEASDGMHLVKSNNLKRMDEIDYQKIYKKFIKDKPMEDIYRTL